MSSVLGRATALAERLNFTQSCAPEHGRLLEVLARGVGDGIIGETGTGCGVGLAWMAGAAASGARLVSIERDPSRSLEAAALFADDPRVRVRCGDWRELLSDGPFDLLVLDGGGQGKGSPASAPLDPAAWLRPGGTLVMDDFAPMTTWPPRYAGQVDTARLHWLDHPLLRATEVRLTPTTASLVAVYVGGLP
jgi:predicted O-methyltransferase YrrM